jgi:hypothetical protein
MRAIPVFCECYTLLGVVEHLPHDDSFIWPCLCVCVCVCVCVWVRVCVSLCSVYLVHSFEVASLPISP